MSKKQHPPMPLYVGWEVDGKEIECSRQRILVHNGNHDLYVNRVEIQMDEFVFPPNNFEAKPVVFQKAKGGEGISDIVDLVLQKLVIPLNMWWKLTDEYLKSR